jgi:hypothetical protein
MTNPLDYTKTSKAAISALLIEQAKDCLLSAIEYRNSNDINKEVQLGLNIHLLLGIILEGVINEIGYLFIDKWTWKELEKVSTPLKWRIISGLVEEFDPSKEPMQTIVKIQKVRNKIAHPKMENVESDFIIISEDGRIYRNMNEEDVLPEGSPFVYIGYGELIKNYNARASQISMKNVLKAIFAIKEHLSIENRFEWCASMVNEIDKIRIEKNEFE